MSPGADAGEKTEQQQQLPKLSASELRQYNRLAEHMDQFHNGFRLSWNEIYKACTTNQRPRSMSLREFITFALRFSEHLEMHHSIEESYVFPKLARKMPAFRKQDELLAQHRKIHEGLDKYAAYLKECKSGERELVLRELKELMETFGEVLWRHLEDEVVELGAENMRKYWTLADMKNLAF